MHPSDDISGLFKGFDASSERKQYREFTPRRDYTETAVVVPTPEPVAQPAETLGTEAGASPPAENPPIIATTPAIAQSLRALLEEQASARQALTQVAKEPLSQRSRPLTIVLISAKGGVGKSTLAATLATALRRPGGKTFLLDLDPQNALRTLHCLRDETLGISQANSIRDNWRSLCQTGFGDTQCLTFGEPKEAQRERFERELQDNPAWLSQQLEHMGLDQRHTLLIDTPTGHSAYGKQALRVADVIIAVLQAEAGSYASLSKLEAQLERQRQNDQPPLCRYIINKVENSTPFNRDMTEVLATRLGSALLGVVHRDARLRESPAYESNPLAQRPLSAGCQDIQVLAMALENLLDEMPG